MKQHKFCIKQGSRGAAGFNYHILCEDRLVGYFYNEAEKSEDFNAFCKLLNDEIHS